MVIPHTYRTGSRTTLCVLQAVAAAVWRPSQKFQCNKSIQDQVRKSSSHGECDKNHLIKADHVLCKFVNFSASKYNRVTGIGRHMVEVSRGNMS